jgi:hypothetical protein
MKAAKAKRTAAVERRKQRIAVGREQAEMDFDTLVAEAVRLRDGPPYFTDEDIRRARKELRR